LQALENACDRLEGKYGVHSVLSPSTGGSENTGSVCLNVISAAIALRFCLLNQSFNKLVKPLDST
jgi:hypothetical protein